MKIFMKVTKDEFELPIAIADSQAELARMLGMPKAAVNSNYSKIRSGKVKVSTFKEVEIDDDD